MGAPIRSTVSPWSGCVAACRTIIAVAATALSTSFTCLASDPAPAQRLDELHAQFTETLEREVGASHDAAAAKLRTSYLNALEQALASSTKSANLGDALALRDEIKRISTTPEAKPTSTEAPPATLAKLREKYETALEKLESDKEKKSQPYFAMYETVLTNYQKDLTKKGDLDGASSVQARLKEVSQGKPVEVAKAGEPKRAKVDIENVSMESFKAGAQVYGDTDRYTWREIPDFFDGFRFARPADHHVATLRFKVLSDGVLYLACTTRWGVGPNDGVQPGEVTSQEKLEKDGWKPLKVDAIQAQNENHSWVFFSRNCKTGETFSLRTEKYASPILLPKN